MEQRLERRSLLPLLTVKLVVGLFFAALGVLLMLDNLRLVHAGDYLRFCPVVFIAIGLIDLTDSTRRLAGILWLAAGAVLLLMTTRLVHFSLFDLWPVLIIGAGLVIVFQAVGWRPKAVTVQSGQSTIAVLSNQQVIVDEKNFSGRRIVAVAGGCQMDLSGADIEHGPAVIEVFVLAGGIELKVPDGWEVIGEAVPFMGGIDIKTRSKRTGRQLVLRGFVMMGGIEIKDAEARSYEGH